MKLLRIIFFYLLYFIACLAFAAILMQGFSGGVLAFIIFVVPGLLVWWHERRREKKLKNEQKETDRASPVLQRQEQRFTGQADIGLETRLAPPPLSESGQNNAELIVTATLTSPQLEAAERRREEISALRAQTPTPQRSEKPVALQSQPVQPVSSISSRRQGWVSKSETVRIAGRNIGGLIYVGTPPTVASNGYRDKCKPYIDPLLKVASNGTDKDGQGMPYWPGYSDIPPLCRSTYLDWLADGRNDNKVNPGYLFLYFYGLERRFLVDRPSEEERRDILIEVERLKRLFPDNFSVQRYLGEFIQVARIVLDDPSCRQPIFENPGWEMPLVLKVTLGAMIANDDPLTSEWVLGWFLCDNERHVRTPATRCKEEFQSLFKLKFDARFPEGMRPRKPKKLLKYNYRAASDEFGGEIGLSARGHPIPDISQLRQPIQIAQEIADEAMNALDKFSRYLGRNPEGRGTLEAHALLPLELWSLFPSDELNELKVWGRHCLEHGGLVPIVDVIKRLQGRKPDKLSKRVLTDAADALARVGIGIAPDPRFSLRAPQLEEPVKLFELGQTVELLENVSTAYRRTLVELALGTFVAQADSQVVEAERQALRAQVDRVPDLNDQERRRLHANLDWLLAVPPDMSFLRRNLKKTTPEQQAAIREVVISIAHADSIIGSEEVAGIEKIYKALGLDPATVYSDLHAGEIIDGPIRVKAAEVPQPGEAIPLERAANRTAQLDAARIAAIRSDTERVSSVLGEIFATDVEPEEFDADLSPSPITGLDKRHSEFIRDVIGRDHWSEEEFAELAKQHGLMAVGVLETINEWAFENHDEALLDEYEGYDVAPDVVTALKAEFHREMH